MSDFEASTTERALRLPPRTDRRRYPRAEVFIAVRELRPERHVLRATSVSPGGLFCPDALPRTPGTSLLLELDLPGGATRAVTARVAESHGRPGCAIAFDVPVMEFEVYCKKS